MFPIPKPNLGNKWVYYGNGGSLSNGGIELNRRTLRVLRQLVCLAVLVTVLGLGALADVSSNVVSPAVGDPNNEVWSDSPRLVSDTDGDAIGSNPSFVIDYEDDMRPLAAAAPSGTRYRIDVDFSSVRSWCDAEKAFWDRDDDNLCWAASASNVLEWTGWGLVDGMTTTDEIFKHFQDHWTDEEGATSRASRWWFDGTAPTSGSASVNVAGGGNFWSAWEYHRYYRFDDDESNMLPAIDDFLRNGFGVGLAISYTNIWGTRHGHAITCWGFNYDDSYSKSDSRYYAGIWVTDSDDNKGYDTFRPWKDSHEFPNKLKYYKVYKSNGKWYIRNYSFLNIQKWHIESIYALGAGPGIPPKVNAGADRRDLVEGSTVSFSGNFVNPGQRWRHSIAWDFGDGTPIVPGTLTPSHVFRNEGVYTVTLSVTDEHGDVGTDTLQVTALDGHPTAEFNWNPFTPLEGSVISFNDLSVSSFDDIVAWSWNFGDGVGTSTVQHPTYSYIEDGPYLVTLTVTDSDGSTDTYSATVTVLNAAPTVDVGPDQIVDEGDTVTFLGGFWDPGVLDTHTIEWNFGDGSPIITGTLTPTHTFADNGVYTVLLTVTDDDGGVGVNELIVTVLNVAPMITTPLDLNQPNPHFILPVVHTLTFTVGFTDPGWLDFHFVTWDFGDGTLIGGFIIEENDEPDATGIAVIKHTFANPGTYLVTVFIEDDDCGVVSVTIEVTVVTAKDALFNINQFIQDLPENAFMNNPTQRKNAVNNKFLAIAHMLNNQAYRGAIENLQHNIRGKADGQVDGTPENDWIIDSVAQQEICSMVDDLIEYLEFLSESSSS